MNRFGNFHGIRVMMGVGFLVTVANCVDTGKMIGGAKKYSLKMTSVMLHYQLSWEPPNNSAEVNGSALRYTVLFRQSRMWRKLEECKNTTATTCDVDNLIPDTYFWFRVTGTLPGSSDVVYTTSTIKFSPKHHTILVPPNITVRYLNGVIFVGHKTPTRWDGTPITKHIEELIYQIQLWPANATDDIRNISTKELNNETSIQVDDPQEYCARIRLYGEVYVRRHPVRNIWSEWSSPPICAKPPPKTQFPTSSPDTSETVIYVCVGVASLFGLTALTFFAYKTCRGCKHMFEKGPLPESWLMVLQNAPDQPSERACVTQNSEFIDSLPVAQSFFQRRNVHHLTLKEASPSTTDICDTQHDTDDYLEYRYPNLPVLEDESAINDTAHLNNMTYGMGSFYEPDSPYCVDEHSSLQLQRRSIYDRMDIGCPLIPSTSSETGSPFSLMENDSFWSALNNQITFGRAPTCSTSSTGSDMGLIFDIQRSNDTSAMTNKYLYPPNQQDYLPEVMNTAYSSDPNRTMPDVIFKKYINMADE